jgi:hypothetical protein
VLATPLIVFPPWINRFYIPRPDAGKELRPLVRRQWHLAVHGQLEVG